MEHHLREQQFPVSTVKEYIHDVFGWSDSSNIYHEGLFDCCGSIAFDALLNSLKEKWEKMEIDTFINDKSHKPLFYDWFLKWKSDNFVIVHCATLEKMLA